MPLVLGAGILTMLYFVFFIAPREIEMGQVQRIFYMHVSCAFSALLLYIGTAILSIGYLVTLRMTSLRVINRTLDRLAVSFAEVAVLFGTIVLVTGPLWAKPAWGEYWTWEPRLTLMLLTQFLFIGYLVLRAYGGNDGVGKRLAAGVAIIGGPAVYLIHVAVRLWGGNHPTVVTEGGGGLEPGAMQNTFWVSLAVIFSFVTYLVYMRYQRHRLAEELDDAFLELSDLEEAA